MFGIIEDEIIDKDELEKIVNGEFKFNKKVSF